MIVKMCYSAKSIIAVTGSTILGSACQGHYNHVKLKYYL